MSQALQEPPAANTPLREDVPDMKHKKPFDLPAFAYKHRGTLVALPLFVAIFCTWHEYENNALIWAAGGAIFAMGLMIRIWSQQYLHFRLRMNMVLTTGGPYSLVRNPIYIGNTLICLGIVVASEVLWMVPVTLLVCCIAYRFVVRYEESYLTKKYGQPYLDYMQRVPRWSPKFSKAPAKLWAPHYLGPSVKTELYNFLFLIPVILKEYLVR